MTGLIYLDTVIFLFLALLHLYWAFGGKWALSTSIPTTHEGKNVFKPGLIGTLIVAIGLFFFAAVVYSQLLGFTGALKSYLQYALLGISFIFLMRSIGDFNYVGLFKRLKGTAFAINDSRIYIPLCLYLAMSCLLIVIL